MTNFTKITSTEETLAHFLDKTILACPPSKDAKDKQERCRAFEACSECWLQYLYSEVETDG